MPELYWCSNCGSHVSPENKYCPFCKVTFSGTSNSSVEAYQKARARHSRLKWQRIKYKLQDAFGIITGVIILAAVLVAVVFLVRWLANDDTDDVINGFLSKQQYLAARKFGKSSLIRPPREFFTIPQGSSLADLNGDGKSEIVLVWTLLGPTYQHTMLTILSKGPMKSPWDSDYSSGYRSVASLELTGEARLSSVKDGVIIVESTVPPTVEKLNSSRPDLLKAQRAAAGSTKQVRYRWTGKTISEVKE